MPYQLHCEVVAQADELALVVVATELELDVLTLELMLVATDVLVATEVATELEVFAELLVDVAGAELVVAAELLVIVVEHTAPVMVGFSAAEPFLSPCTPKLTDCPGWIVLFQSSAVAE